MLPAAQSGRWSQLSVGLATFCAFVDQSICVVRLEVESELKVVRLDQDGDYRLR